MKKSLLFLLPVALGLSSAYADVTLPPLISDNLLLQSAHAAVWGKADPGEKVTVTLGKTTASATADQEGKWRVQLPGLKPGEAGVMTIEGKNKLSVQNVAVGDVWVCSGQSNMEMPVVGPWGGNNGVVNVNQEIAAANFPQIRMFTVAKKSSETPIPEVQGKWEVCTPDTVPRWSAVGYFFGRQLHQDLKIPVGLIHTSWGGTPAQAWMPTETLQGDADFKKTYYDTRQVELANYPALKEAYEKGPLAKWQVEADAAKAEGKPAPRKPYPPLGPGMGGSASALYNGMILGVTPFPIKGAIWYQGESNAGDAPRYRRLLPAMITSWRKAWNQGEFPFYIVQLANFMAPQPKPTDCKWADLRDAQRLTAETLPNTGMAVAIEVGEEKCIHPANKQDVGRRLALAAEAKTYGQPVVSSGPWFEAAKFDGAEAKLTFKPGTAAGLTTPNGEAIKGFAIAGEDKKFVWAEAKIIHTAPSGDTLVLTAPEVAKPVAVRYAWANNPAVNLVNKAGLPAVPFRTDDWPQVEGGAPSTTPRPAIQLPANAGANLALNKKYTCPTPNTSGWDRGLVDGAWDENAAHTFATDSSSTLPKMVTIDLEKPADLGLVVVGVPPFGATKTIAVSVSLDGTEFKEVGSYAFNQYKSEQHVYSFQPTAARFVRLTYPDHYDTAVTYGVNHAFTTEVEVYAPGKVAASTTPRPAIQLPANAGPNLALHKKYICPTPNTFGWGGGLVDGAWDENSSHTFATDMSATFPKSVTIDLEKSDDLGLVVVGVPAFGATKTVAVSVSTDGTAFKEVGTYVFSQKKAEQHLYSFPPTAARFIRLTYPDHYDTQVNYPVNFIFTTEVEAYAPGKAQAATAATPAQAAAAPTPAPRPAIQLPANAGANLALHKKYTCPTPNASGWGVGLVDGAWDENAAHTFATDPSATFPKTVTIDLEKSADLGLVVVGVPAFGSTKTIAVSVSTDGVAFKEVGSYVFSQKKAEQHLYSFPPTAARFVRLTYPDHYDIAVGYTPTYAFTTEVEAYAPGK